jgi:hypothetical protein
MCFGLAEANPTQRTCRAQNMVVSAFKEGVLGAFAVVGQFLLGRKILLVFVYISSYTFGS